MSTVEELFEEAWQLMSPLYTSVSALGGEPLKDEMRRWFYAGALSVFNGLFHEQNLDAITVNDELQAFARKEVGIATPE